MSDLHDLLVGDRETPSEWSDSCKLYQDAAP